MKKDILNTLKILLAAVVISFSVSAVYAAWTAPTATPPGNNAFAPINTSTTSQAKPGDLGVNSFFADNAQFGNTGGGTLSQSASVDIITNRGTNAFQVWDDNNLSVPKFIVKRNGNVGVGTTNPTAKLDVAGSGIKTTYMTAGNSITSPYVNASETLTAKNVNVSGGVRFPDNTVQTTAVAKESCGTYTGSGWRSARASCGGGRTVRGGGCSSNGGNGYGSYPSGNGWNCSWGDGSSVTAYAICCN